MGAFYLNAEPSKEEMRKVKLNIVTHEQVRQQMDIQGDEDQVPASEPEEVAAPVSSEASPEDAAPVSDSESETPPSDAAPPVDNESEDANKSSVDEHPAEPSGQEAKLDA